MIRNNQDLSTIPACQICGDPADVEDTIYGRGGMKLLVTAYCNECRAVTSWFVSHDPKNHPNDADVVSIVREAQAAAKNSLRESARAAH